MTSQQISSNVPKVYRSKTLNCPMLREIMLMVEENMSLPLKVISVVASGPLDLTELETKMR